MADVDTVVAGLVTRLRTIGGINVPDHWPGTITAPCILVKPVESAPVVIDESLFDEEYEVLVLLPEADRKSAQAQLNAYCSRTGSRSIRAAILGDVTLGGQVANLMISGFQDNGGFALSDGNYLGARWTVTVFN